MLKINNLQKKIIKISTVISLVMISSFFLINKVNAEDFTINQLGANFVFHDTGIENYISNISEENINNIINDMIDTYQQYDFVFDSYLILYVPETNMYDFIIFDKNLLNHTPAYNGMKLTFLNMPSSNIYRLQNTSFGSPKYSAKTLRMNLSDNNLLNYSFQTSITDGTNARNLVDGINHDTYNVYYYTNVNNYKIYEGKNHLGTLNNNKDNIGPKTYEFNEDIDVTDISKIKINFELPEDTSNLEVDIKWTFDNYTSGGNGYITTPYLEFKHSNGDISLNQDISNLNGGDWFSDNYIATLLPDSDITGLTLIVDTIKASGLLKANFSSKFPYSISYEYTEEVEDYFITIDMDDYASISLIPKVHNLENGISSSISSPIYKYGIYDVEIWEDLETKKVIDRWDNHSTSQFIYPMYSGYKNCIIHFIKKEVDASERYIKFDSRYYSYVVKKYLNEEVIITNPNTNEDITIPDTSDLYKYDSSVDKRFSFNSFLKPIKFVFESITDFYNNYCPEVVQYFFYLIFAFFVILVLIKIFL